MCVCTRDRAVGHADHAGNRDFPHRRVKVGLTTLVNPANPAPDSSAGRSPPANSYRSGRVRPRFAFAVGSETLIVAVHALHALVTLLRLDRQGCDRPCLEPADADRLVGFLAIPVGAEIDALQGGVDL